MSNAARWRELTTENGKDVTVSEITAACPDTAKSPRPADGCALPPGCDNRSVIEAAVRAAAVPPFHAMAMSREAARLEASGRRILHLEVGQPSTPLPALAREAVRAHLDEQLGYTNAAGIHASHGTPEDISRTPVPHTTYRLERNSVADKGTP